MAGNATIYKATLSVANMDTHNYGDHSLTLAQHPSENELRLMVRLVAFILNADEALSFTRGMAQEDEPDLWKKNAVGEIELSIILGQPDEKRIKKACGTSEEVIIYTYQKGMAEAWLKQNEKILKRFKNLKVIALSFSDEIELLCKRSINLQCNVLDNELTLITDDYSIIVYEDLCEI